MRELAGITESAIAQQTNTKYVLVEATVQGLDFKQLDKAAQKVWAATGDAKKIALVSLINSFRFKGKQNLHLTKAEEMTDPNKMDKFAADLMQVGHDNKVIR